MSNSHTDADHPDAGHTDAGHTDADRTDAGHTDAGHPDADRTDAERQRPDIDHPRAAGPLPPLARRPVQRVVVLLASLGMAIVTVATPVSPPPKSGDRGEPAVFQVDLNRADVRELSLLPGIGPVLARRIVRHRDRHGPFRQLDDLADVSGIGPKRLDELAQWCLPPRSPTSG